MSQNYTAMAITALKMAKSHMQNAYDYAFAGAHAGTFECI